jgi:hypothetical protein
LVQLDSVSRQILDLLKTNKPRGKLIKILILTGHHALPKEPGKIYSVMGSKSTPGKSATVRQGSGHQPGTS